MTRHDPFWRQKRTKWDNRRKILAILRENPATFGELRDRVDLSRPVLSGYLQQLTKEQVITKQVQGRRVEYILTQRGKTVELIGSKLVSAALQKAGSIVQDPKGAKLLADMANMASANPEMFQIITDWALNIGLLTTSDPVFESRWLQVLAGDREAWHPFEEEINKRASTAQPKTLDELKEALDDIQQGIRKVFEAQKIKRSKK